ncbi:putative transmembrane protein INAFM2 [Tubulanus polymorphus]|uniref:putative transmembrane protein INAFM2 n=1 Tax=Tubulanus polymorphus TaxID=672921 RepID=UPI003DA56759
MRDENSTPHFKPPKAFADDKPKLQKNKGNSNKKWVRLATVFAYVLSVSLAATVLAIYYSLFWNPQLLSAGNSTTTVKNNVTGTTVAGGGGAGGGGAGGVG